MKKNPLNIILVEDDQADIKIAQRTFAQSECKNNVFFVNDGRECLKYLSREGTYSDKKKYPWPDLILLDINMPGVDGFEVLKTIKTHPIFKLIPVIVLSGSKNDMDIHKSYENGANGFIQKSLNYEEFLRVMDIFNCYWQTIMKLPGSPNR